MNGDAFRVVRRFAAVTPKMFSLLVALDAETLRDAIQ
jgi:hypothetical protein